MSIESACFFSTIAASPENRSYARWRLSARDSAENMCWAMDTFVYMLQHAHGRSVYE